MQAKEPYGLTIIKVIRNRVGAVAGGSEDFFTTFSADEAEISEGGVWIRSDSHSTPIKTVGGIALGTQTGSGAFDDSQATLVGFPTVCRIEAQIFRHPSISANNHEVELCFCTQETGSATKKYEFLGNRDGGIQFINWVDNAAGNFQDLGTNIFGPLPLDVDDFNWIAAEIDVDTINEEVTLRCYSKVNQGDAWDLKASTLHNGSGATGAVLLSGPPGIGTFIGSAGADADHFGFRSVRFIDRS